MSHLPRLRPLTRLLLRPQRPHNPHLRPLPTLTTPTIHSKPQTRTLRSATATSATATTATTSPQNMPPSQATPVPNEAYEITQAETQLTTQPLLQALRSDKSYTETRPHLSMIPTHRASHFVAGTLSGAHKVTVPPYVFTRTKPTHKNQPPPNESTHQPAQATQPQALAQTISLFHLGTTLNGHPGYVHGGLLSVMFDETFARCVAASFASGVGMTANLSVDFRKPARPDRVYVLRAETVRVEGRKAWVEGSLTSLPPAGSVSEEEGTMVAEARALFVEPKFAESMVPLYRN
ncbi:hypothetical protein ASPACDRAFT_39962 [Aspergillus aculeatus ATCC 16872]|uniref:Thioesterase domain-containing protein n=1 Tax=Aspergillus aculeatus (strain ATCC 16872 / CBS 172.66 / WB 5094) TaxID=690307 RepID=A0A1L9X2G3_ASPA1|nr:uncharacterized protein ASPACDRAFT_39962 [Aspergillus aculeatus ATCC 16872]OJK02651.1 hypothetical protein ASPACDRAFT_39962 [Aspergillus aculeatus ATCC 16872]